MTEVAATYGEQQELVLLGQMLARPDLVEAVGISPKKLRNETVRAMVKVLLAEGPTYAAPGPMIAALKHVPEDVDLNVAQAAFILQPDDADEVTLRGLVELKKKVEVGYDNWAFVHRITSAMADIDESTDATELARKLKRYVTEFNLEAINKDHTSGGILARLKQAPPKIRWRCGIEDLDFRFQGIGPDGQPAHGMLAQKEVVVLAAGYKAGKTREMLNWVVALLDQGASLAMFVLEDDEGSFAVKLMAAKSRVPKFLIERYLLGGVAFLGAGGADLAERIEAAINWWEGIGERLRIYDASTKQGIFKFESALEVMGVDCALYSTTHVVVDYVQQWGGEYKEMASYAFGLRAFAAEHNVCMVEISQFSNESIKFGSGAGQLAAKGAGEWGQTCHVGLELVSDPMANGREFCLWLKVARDAESGYVFVTYDLSTGTRLRYYGTPESEGFQEMVNGKKQKAKGARK